MPLLTMTHQHHKADQGDDADLHPCQQQGQEAAGEGQGNGKHDDQRRAQGLELGHHHQIHQHDAQQQHQQQLPDGVHDGLVLPLEGGGDALGQLRLADDLFGGGGDLGDVIAVGHVGGHGDIPPLLVPVDGVQADSLL
jgi:hypothetical protein